MKEFKNSIEYVPLDEFDFTDGKKFDAEKWEINREIYQNHIQKCWGKFPNREKLEVEFIEESEKKGYKIQKYKIRVSYSNNKYDDFIPVWLMIPNKPREDPCPTMIIHHQHAGQFNLGKSEPSGEKGDPGQAFGLELVKRGFIVAVFDALAFEERQEPGGEKFSFTRLLMYGMTLNGKYCYDVSRVIDFLYSQEIVAKERIGIMGHSLGGQMSLWSALFDTRLKLIVSSCGFGRIDGPNSIIGNNLNHNFALYCPDLLDPKINIDMHEIIGLLHPRLLVLVNGVMDGIFPIEGVAEIHQFEEDLYHNYGNIGLILTIRHTSYHRAPENVRNLIYIFIEKKL